MSNGRNVPPIDKDEPTGEGLYEGYLSEAKALSDTKRNIRRREKAIHKCSCGAVFSGIGSRWTFKEHLELAHKVGVAA